MVDELRKVGRVAFRHEGENWNAYYALPDTMEKAFFLGAIRMGAVANHPEIKQAFMDLMRNVVTTFLEESVGAPVEWKEPEPAPENERAGHG